MDSKSKGIISTVFFNNKNELGVVGILLVLLLFNSFGLPHGLTYLAICTPFLVFYVIISNYKKLFFSCFFFIGLFGIIHYSIGIVFIDYLKSFLLFFSVLSFIFSAWIYFETKKKYLDRSFRIFASINWALFLIAIPFYFTEVRELFWYKNIFTVGYDNFYRLSLFTYEASFYALCLTPFILYFLLDILRDKSLFKSIFYLSIVLIPFLFALSFGVIACLLFAVAITGVIYFKSLIKNNKFKLLLSTSILAVLFVVAILYVIEDNVIVARLQNVLLGKDTSAIGRTEGAFVAAYEIAKHSSIWIGAGLGQVKIVAQDLSVMFFEKLLDETFRIPNSIGEYFAIYGVVGITIKLLLELALFFKFKVWRNVFQLSIFLFIFSYQFTGSFIFNYVEYFIWILAFLPLFKEFDLKNLAYKE